MLLIEQQNSCLKPLYNAEIDSLVFPYQTNVFVQGLGAKAK